MIHDWKTRLIGYFVLFSSLLYASQLAQFTRLAFAETTTKVVINEIAWAGSKDNADDEWIELFNLTKEEIDLTGWKIIDDGSTTYEIKSGKIAANGYFLIEDTENTVSSIIADAVISISLANSGDSLELKDNTGSLLDAVNQSGGAWFAGNNEQKTSMERIDAEKSGDDGTNWKSNTNGSGATASGGSPINGTPRAKNSAQAPNEKPAYLVLSVDQPFPQPEETIEIKADAVDVINLFSYGAVITYNPDVLEFKSATKGAFLSESDKITTSFQSGLENGIEGKLVVAEARTMTSNKSGITGNGLLFSLRFEVIGENGTQSTIKPTTESFMATPETDLNVSYQSVEVTVKEDSQAASQVKNLSAKEGAERYSLSLNWSVPTSGADEYSIKRKTGNGTFEELGKTKETSFTDSKNIIPTLTYTYQVIAKNSQTESQPVETTAKETRGIIGDNNRSDRVDGRDLQSLAKHFGESDQDSQFSALVDTTNDSRIDGNDLVDIGANWAKVFKPS